MLPEPIIDSLQPSQYIFNVSPEMLDYLPNALGVLALDGTIRAVNRAALKLLNVHSSAIIGRHFSHFLRSVEPPLLPGGFQKLLELGGAIFDIALRCGEDRFVQVEIQLVVIHDEQAQQSGVLVMSSEGDAQNILLRQAVAQVADQVSRVIAYGSSGEGLWSKLFSLCQELFETSGGWLLLRGAQGQQTIPFTFGLPQREFTHPRGSVTIHNCPCAELSGGGTQLNAANCMDCPWFASVPECSDAMPWHHAVAPILNNAGERIGDICLIAPPGRIFHHHELLLMDVITDQIGQALDRGELHLPAQFTKLDRHALTTRYHALPELATFVREILHHISTLVSFVGAAAFLHEGDGMRLVAASNPLMPDVEGRFFPYSQCLLNAEVVRTRSRMILDDVRQDSRFFLWEGHEHIRGWMCLPLVVNDAVIGMITVDSDRVGGFSQQDGEVAQVFANQAAIAVEKAQLAAELRLEKANLELLYQLSQKLAATLEPQDVAEKALKLIAETFNDCFGEIYVVESGQEFLQLLAARNHSPHVLEKLPGQPYLRIGEGITGKAVEMRRPIVVPDVDEDPRWVRIPDLDQHLNVRSMAATPLVARNEVVGVLVLGGREVNIFTHDLLPLLQSIAAPVALALQNARLFAAERSRRQEAEMLRNAASTITLDLNLEQILHILLERLRQVVHFDSACVMLVEGQELHALAAVDLPRPDEVLGQRFPLDGSFFADVQRGQQAVFFADVQALPGFFGWGGTSTTRGWMGVPLIHRGEVMGYITLDSLQVSRYGQEEAGLAQAFADQIAITIVNTQFFQESQRAALQQQAISTILRGLNSALSLAEMQAAVTDGLHHLLDPAAVEVALYQLDERHVHAGRSQWAEGEEQASTSVHSYGMDESAAIPTLLEGQTYVSSDTAEESQWSVEREWASRGYPYQMALPLQGSDRILGHIRLLWRDRIQPNLTVDFSLRQVVDGVAMAAERLELLSQTIRRADELQMLIRLSSQLRTTEERTQITSISLATCLDVFHADQGYVLVPTANAEMLEVIAHVGGSPIAPGRYLGLTESIAGRVFSDGTPYCSPNLLADPLAHWPNVQLWIESGVTFVSSLYVPLRAGDEIVGVLSLTNTETRRSFLPADLRLLNAVAEIVGGALHRALILEGLEQRVNDRTAQLRDANVKLLELDQMKSDFVANVSHELRTPLTNIKLYLDLLRNGRVERRERYLQVLETETERLHVLIESILDLSSLDENRTDIDSTSFVVVSLHEVMEETMQRFHEQASAADLDLTYLPAGQSLTILGNPERLTQMVGQLVKNAITYTKPGGKVELSIVQNQQGEVGMVVRDTGIGIPPEEIGQVFERFYRSKQVRSSGMLGTGLGLPIVHKIAQAHGGRVIVESTLDAGTTFTAWLSAYSLSASS